MPEMIADGRDVAFALYDQMEAHLLGGEFAPFGRKTADLILAEARALALGVLLPTWKTGDLQGCAFEKGNVTTPDGFPRAWRLLAQGGWIAPEASPAWGGQGMPKILAEAVRNYLVGGNFALMMLVSLNHAAGRLIEAFGTDRQKSLYLTPLFSGKWAGTMMLTESEAGSDLGRITAAAARQPDGTFLLSGAKIFISGGEQDITENIIHLVLARIEGAPEGAGGLSLFIVPKIRVNDDGNLGERNDIHCTGIEEKLGLHGSPTCAMAFGEKDGCIGELLGEENRGVAQMFLMMNEMRLTVAAQATACASSAYLHALEFAKTRIQGALPESKEKSVPLIRHPDIRRMLITMKMTVEGMRSLLFFIARCEDRKLLAESPEEKEMYRDLIDVLTPVGKGYGSDRAVAVCDLAVQVLGGYGYTKEYPVEQLLRDVRVTPLYEGTNGIQAIDLLKRKLCAKDGRAFHTLLHAMEKTIEKADKISSLKPLSSIVRRAAAALTETADCLKVRMSGPAAAVAYAHAYPFLEATGDLVMAWMLLWRAQVAAQACSPGKKKSFYDGQAACAEYFIRTVLPRTESLLAVIRDGCDTAVTLPEEAFG